MKPAFVFLLLTHSLTVCHISAAASGAAYEPVLDSGNQVGPFTTNGKVINYQSRAGAIDIMKQVMDEPEYAVYVQVEKAYTFGPNKYVLVISTAEGGNSCPATTYTVSFDTRTEMVDGKTLVDGCSDEVDVSTDGNKLIVKKDGAPTIVYDGSVR